MIRRVFCAAVVAVLVQFAIGRSVGAPPKVVKAVPDNGDVDVDPALKEIRITFDQPMSEDMSVVGGGDSFPAIQGRPRWVTSKTIAIRVKLRPNHEYWLSANNERFRNFANRAGEPAVPYPIQFRTGPGGGAPRDDTPSDEAESAGSRPLTESDNRRALNLLRSSLRDSYSYQDRLKINWDQLFRERESALVAAKSPEEFAKIAGTLLARAQDKHIWLRVDEQTIPSYVRPAVPNANYGLLPKLVPNLKKHGRAVASGHWDDGIGYIAIAAWDRGRLENGKSLFDALDAVHDTKSLIIDVRLNGGGDERLAQQLAGCFVDERRLYAKHVYRDPNSPSGFTPPSERWLEPNPNRMRYAGRLAVLSGPVVMSSCEAFLKMVKQVPEAVIVGDKSQGSSGNPKPHDLSNGVTVFLPSWKDMSPDGREFEGLGITPDIEVKASPADFQRGDPVLDAALAHLRAAGNL